MRIALVLAALAALPLGAQERKPDPKKKAPPEPKTWMCRKGELLWEEKFEGTALSKDWHKGQGDWVVESGVLKGAEKPADNHHAYASRGIAQPNVIIQFSFKLEGAGWAGGFFDGKEHVSALTLGADTFRIARMSGIGPTSKRTDVDSTKMKLNDAAWHTVVWEFMNDEMVATVDDQAMAIAKAEGLSMERRHLELNTAGGQWALFRDVKVWRAEADDKWPQKRAQLLQLMKKKPAQVGYK
jgi:hypothetical protein